MHARAQGLSAFLNGLQGETRAQAFMCAQEYTLLRKRYRSPYGEIDLIFQRDDLLVFLEVKACVKLEDAAYALGARQKRRLWRAAHHFLTSYEENAFKMIRFDVILVSKDSIHHLLNAFSCDNNTLEDF